MKFAVLLALLAPSLVFGCASDSERMARLRRPSKHGRAAASETSFEDSLGASQMGVQNEIGVYNASDLEEALGEHMDEVRACYARAGHAQKYAGGQVTLRFIVRGDGKPRDVLVIATELGNYDVERCLVDVARGVQFPPPDGKKATTFEYPVEFKSTHEVQVQDLDGSLKIDHDINAQMHSLSGCGSVADGGASASFYIGSGGTVSSVGLAAESPLNEKAGACVAREIRRWRMSTSLPGRMLRYKMTIPALGGSARSSMRPVASQVAAPVTSPALRASVSSLPRREALSASARRPRR